jgi:soluble P-type ATPase
MILLKIPGGKSIEVKNVVFDFNGTIAEDGILINGINKKIIELSSENVDIFIVTADTNGTVIEQCKGLPVNIMTFDQDDAAEVKKKIVEELGYANTVSIGNGRNDVGMFNSSALSVAVIGREGCFAKTLIEADIVVNNPLDVN